MSVSFRSAITILQTGSPVREGCQPKTYIEVSMNQLFSVPLVLALMAASPAICQDHAHPAAGEKLGTVHFATSCAAAAQPEFDCAVSLLHSFEFGAAIASFDAALKADPKCAMTQWGVALSRWGNPFAVGTRSAAQVKNGLAAVERARAIGAATERERAYIDAVANLYADAERRPQRARVEAYRDAMGQLTQRFPDDNEAPIFYALSLTAAEDINDKTYASRLQAVGILEPMFAKQPNHPGLAHYIIHSYDVPALAPRALGAAKALRGHRAVRAARPAHAVAHLHARRAVAAIDRSEHRLRSRRESTEGDRRRAARLRLSDVRLSPDGAGRRGETAARGAAGNHRPIRCGGSRGGGAAIGGLLCDSGDSGAMGARTRRMGGRGEARGAIKRSSLCRCPDRVRARVGAARSGDVAKARAAVTGLEALRARQAEANEPVLDAADRHPAPRCGRVGRIRRRAVV